MRHLAVLAAGALLLAGCGGAGGVSPAVAPPTPTPKTTFSVAVQIDLSTYIEDGVMTCSGSGGFADMAEGAQVKISDATGAIVGLGTLGGGIAIDTVPSVTGSNICRFVAVVSDVPIKDGIYGVEVSHRGVVSFKRDGDPTKVELTLRP